MTWAIWWQSPWMRRLRPVPAVPGTFQGGVGRSAFLTRPLWGVGSTAPYMQDGNSTTLTEAIDRHGGEAADSRARFRQLSEPSQGGGDRLPQQPGALQVEDEAGRRRRGGGGGTESREKPGHQPTDTYMRRMR